MSFTSLVEYDGTKLAPCTAAQCLNRVPPTPLCGEGDGLGGPGVGGGGGTGGGGVGGAGGGGGGAGVGAGGSTPGHVSHSATSTVKSGDSGNPAALVETGVVEPSMVSTHSPVQPVRFAWVLKTGRADTFTAWLAL